MGRDQPGGASSTVGSNGLSPPHRLGLAAARRGRTPLSIRPPTLSGFAHTVTITTESPAHCGANGAPHAAHGGSRAARGRSRKPVPGREIDHPVLRQRIGEPQRRFDGARLKTLLAGVPRRVFIPGAGSGARSPAGVLDVHGLCDHGFHDRRAVSVIDAHGVKHEDEEYAGAEEQRRTAHVAPLRAQIGMLPLIARA